MHSRRCYVCGKIRYATKEAAQKDADKLVNRDVIPYEQHGWWHLTSEQRSERGKHRKSRPKT